jgi:hypothetical protein
MKNQNKTKRLLTALLLAGLVGLSSAAMAATITYDQEDGDYAPWEWVTLTGTGFAPNSDITVTITWPDGSGDDIFWGFFTDSGFTWCSVTCAEDLFQGTADGEGGFTLIYEKTKVEGTFIVKATDDAGNEATTTFTDAANYNTTTTLNAIATPLTPGQTSVSFSGQVSASTPVPDGAPVTLQYKLSTGGGPYSLMATASTTGGNGSFSGTFTAPNADGTYLFRADFAAYSLTATWKASWSADQTIAVGNRTPTVAVDPPKSVTVEVGQTAEETGTFGDPDDDTVTLSASVGTVTAHAEGTWSWSHTTTDADVGSQHVTITADDGKGGTATAKFNLVVTASPTPTPTVTGVSPSSGEQGTAGSVVITGTNFTGATLVSFGAGVAVNSFTVDGATQITAAISIGGAATPGPRDVSVTTPAGTGTGSGLFTVTADATDPVGGIKINGGALYTSSFEVTLNLWATDGVGITGYRVADGLDALEATTVAVSSTLSFSADIGWTLPGNGTRTVAVQYRDAAGNWTDNFTASIVVDTTPPVVTGTLDPAANAAGWNNSDVTITWSASDPESGITSGPTPASSTATLELAGQDFTSQATNGAGLIGTGLVTVNLDKTAPVIAAGVPDGTAGNNGWWRSAVTVPFTATDSLSGFAPDGALSTNLASKSTSGDGKGLTVTSDGVSDLADNAATAVSAGPYDVDSTAPVLSVTWPAVVHLTLNQSGATATANWSATDATSGFDGEGTLGTKGSASWPLPTDLSHLGKNTMHLTVTTSDWAGNPATQEMDYVYYVEYAFGGFLPPINVGGKGLFKLGSTIPVKFQLTDASGAYVNNAVAHIYVAKITGIIIGTDEVPTSTSAANDGNLFRYDPIGCLYIFNWGTKGLTAGTWQIKADLDDGSSHVVPVSLK